MKTLKQDGLNREHGMVYFPGNLKCTKLVLNMFGNFNVWVRRINIKNTVAQGFLGSFGRERENSKWLECRTWENHLNISVHHHYQSRPHRLIRLVTFVSKALSTNWNETLHQTSAFCFIRTLQPTNDAIFLFPNDPRYPCELNRPHTYSLKFREQPWHYKNLIPFYLINFGSLSNPYKLFTKYLSDRSTNDIQILDKY